MDVQFDYHKAPHPIRLNRYGPFRRRRRRRRVLDGHFALSQGIDVWFTWRQIRVWNLCEAQQICLPFQDGRWLAGDGRPFPNATITTAEDVDLRLVNCLYRLQWRHVMHVVPGPGWVDWICNLRKVLRYSAGSEACFADLRLSGEMNVLR